MTKLGVELKVSNVELGWLNDGKASDTLPSLCLSSSSPWRKGARTTCFCIWHEMSFIVPSIVARRSGRVDVLGCLCVRHERKIGDPCAGSKAIVLSFYTANCHAQDSSRVTLSETFY